MTRKTLSGKWSYTASRRGYMICYRGQPCGGSCMRAGRGSDLDQERFVQTAKRAIANIKRGYYPEDQPEFYLERRLVEAAAEIEARLGPEKPESVYNMSISFSIKAGDLNSAIEQFAEKLAGRPVDILVEEEGELEAACSYIIRLD